MPTIISAILSIFDNVVSGITATQKAEIALKLQENQNLTDLLQAQAKINEIEAANPSLWVSGARPAILWICAAAFAWEFVVQPMITYVIIVTGHPMPVLPAFDTSTMVSILMGMLGLSGMRSWEKYKGVAK